MHRPRHGRTQVPLPVMAEILPATYVPRLRKKANAAIVALVGIARFQMSPTINTRVSPDPLPTLSAGDFLFHISIERGRRPQAAGHRAMPSDHRAQAAGRRLSINPRISPIYKAAGRRSSILEPSNSIALSAPNKNRSLVEGSCSKKKLTPLHLKCEECHAICDLDLSLIHISEPTRPY